MNFTPRTKSTQTVEEFSKLLNLKASQILLDSDHHVSPGPKDLIDTFKSQQIC